MATDTVPAAVPGPPEPTGHTATTNQDSKGFLASMVAAVEPARSTFDLTPTTGQNAHPAEADGALDRSAPGVSSDAFRDTSEATAKDAAGQKRKAQGSVWKAWWLAGAQRWAKGGGNANKRLDVKKAQAQAHQVKETRTTTVAKSGGLPIRNSGGSGAGVNKGSQKPGGNSPGKGPTNSSGNRSNGSGRGGSGGGTGGSGGGRGTGGGTGSNGSGAGGRHNKGDAAPKNGRGNHGSGGSGSGSGRPKDSSGSGTGPKGDRRSPASKDSGKHSGPAGGGSGTGGSGKPGTSGKSGKDGAPGKTGSGSGTGGKTDLTKSPKSSKSDTTPGPHGGSGSSGPASKSPAGKDGAPKNGTPDGKTDKRSKQQPPTRKTPLEKSRETGHGDGTKARRVIDHVKAYTDGTRDGWDDEKTQNRKEHTRLDKAHTTHKAKPAQPVIVTEQEDDGVTADVKPLTVKNIDANTLTLGADATRTTYGRRELRNFKQYERKLEAKETVLQKISEACVQLKKEAEDEAKDCQDLVEQAKTVEGGEKLLGKLNKLADDAKNQAAEAAELAKQAKRAAEMCKVVLTNIQTRYAPLYKAVVDSGETKPAELRFYNDKGSYAPAA